MVKQVGQALRDVVSCGVNWTDFLVALVTLWHLTSLFPSLSLCFVLVK